jgi:ABC-2 type transport system ATP-binding protein
MIRLNNLTFAYPSPYERTLKTVAYSMLKRLQDYRQQNSGQRNVIERLNLEIQSGDRLGIIGPNGAGKSTLLKIISGIYPPTSGTIQVSGKIACLFELATGFEMEYTGWENIRVRGLLLGLSRKEIDAKVHEIAEFSGLGEALNMPVKCYSSGMFVRLAFSVSTAINPEILLLDEVIGAGDLAFAEQAKARLLELMEKSSIMILVSHSLDNIVGFCNRAILLEKGTITAEGNPKDVISEYRSKYGH